MPDPVCVGDSILVELRAVRTSTTEPDGRLVYGETTAYLVVAFHNGYSRQWRYPATPAGLRDAWTAALDLFRRCADAAEGGRMWVDL